MLGRNVLPQPRQGRLFRASLHRAEQYARGPRFDVGRKSAPQPRQALRCVLNGRQASEQYLLRLCIRGNVFPHVAQRTGTEDDPITATEALRRDPAAIREDRVVRRASEFAPIAQCNSTPSAGLKHACGDYFSLTTAARNHRVTDCNPSNRNVPAGSTHRGVRREARPRVEDRVEHQVRPHRQDVGVSDLPPATAVVGGLRRVAEDQLDAALDGPAPSGLELRRNGGLELLKRRAVRDGLEQRLVDVEQDVELRHTRDRPGAGAGELAQGVE